MFFFVRMADDLVKIRSRFSGWKDHIVFRGNGRRISRPLKSSVGLLALTRVFGLRG